MRLHKDALQTLKNHLSDAVAYRLGGVQHIKDIINMIERGEYEKDILEAAKELGLDQFIDDDYDPTP